MSEKPKTVVVPFRADRAAEAAPPTPVEAFYGAGPDQRTGVDRRGDGFFAVNFDMARSSVIAAASSDLFPANGARLFEAEVKTLTARAADGLSDALIGSAVFLGDGGHCAFASAGAAHAYAEALHALAEARNERVASPSRWWRFRVGVGGLEVETHDFEFRVRDRASVLEVNAAPGGTLIDEHAYCSLPPSLRRLYGGQETIKGKRPYRAHRRAR